MSKSPEEYAHIEWLGYVQPVGLVVSVPAMLNAQCFVDKNIMSQHGGFLSCLPQEASSGSSRRTTENLIPEIRDLRQFTQRVLGWEDADLVNVPASGELPADLAGLEVVLPQYHETLRPTHVVPEFQPKSNANEESKTNNYLLLVKELPTGTDFDQPGESDSARHWNAAPHAKFERLLREAKVPIGLMSNGRQLRLIYAPYGETSGHATFNVDEMTQVAGRPMFAALHMLLCSARMFSMADNQRLPAILANSRKYQNTVSTQLAEQVMSALFDLLRGFQAADDHRDGELLRSILANDPQHVYHGLLTILMRSVFVLFAEDRDLLSSDPVYANHYSITGLFKRLREDAGRFPDTMDQRFGAWAQMLTLFRLIYTGGQHGEMKIPPRDGYLFDPNRYPFLEGRFDDNDVNIYSDPERLSPIQVPRVSDGVVYRVLQNLLVLDGERLSYRALDVEQIGSVYEAIMGFELQVSTGRSIAIKPVKRHGAPATINLESLLDAKPADRAKRLKEWTDQKLGTADAKAMKAAETVEELVAALDKKIAKHVTQSIVPADSMVFQPSDERRRSGSHYTPRSLTEPIVRTTLEPILAQLLVVSDELLEKEADLEEQLATVAEKLASAKRDNPKLRTKNKQLTAQLKQTKKEIAQRKAAAEVETPHPAQILQLKICDPAMGSGAFLVEACRHLADILIESWRAHDVVPTDIPPDEDEVLYARRLVAQRCLYGVDKNVMAVDLAKLSLWLVTLARDHAFTFLDHSLRYGDSLVGLTREQIIAFHWDPKKQLSIGEDLIQKRLDKATESRAKILNARENVAYRDQQQRLAIADEALRIIRTIGDACVSAFFAGKKKNERKAEREKLQAIVSEYFTNQKTNNYQLATNLSSQLREAARRLKEGDHPIPAFHWNIEFPEVFSRENGGFDAFVGNPPFAGKNTLKKGTKSGYPDWLKEIHDNSHGNSDLVAHFFRRCFLLCRTNTTVGFVATNTLSQGDTRHTGLRWIRSDGKGTIYKAIKRLPWPGDASVIVSVVHILKGKMEGPFLLDAKQVDRITAYLLTSGGDDSPFPLEAQKKLAFQGSILLGMGFTFDDTDNTDVTNSLADMRSIVNANPSAQERIAPYIGGDEANNVPDHAPYRYTINFADFPLERTSNGGSWNDLSVNEQKNALRQGVVPTDYPDPVARDWPQLVKILEQKVKPVRAKDNREIYRRLWWQFGEKRIDLYRAIEPLERVLAINCGATPHMSFTFLPTNMIFANTLDIIAFDDFSTFCLLQCRVHESWARRESSSMKDDLRYTPTDVFETFPFPATRIPEMAQQGERYFTKRAQIMLSGQIGLTKTYNRFHDKGDVDKGILELRRLHGLMDGAVLRAYGWDELAEQAEAPDFCEFLLDYEEEESNEPGAKKSKKKKPWRYRWPDEFRDEVLARLLELNEQRHKEELLGASSQILEGKKVEPQSQEETKQKKKAGAKKSKAKKAKPAEVLPLLPLEQEHRYLLMILRAFDDKAVSTRLLNQCLILMLDDQLRTTLISKGTKTGSKRTASIERDNAQLSQFVNELEIDGYINKVPSEHQAMWQITELAPTTDTTEEDIQRVSEVMAIVDSGSKSGSVTISEETVDGKFDFIPA